jgi:hypothetical protein
MEIYYESKRTNRQLSIKKTYTLKTINSYRTHYLKDLHNFVKDNKDFFLNLILNLEKKEQLKDKDNNENNADKNNSQTFNQFENDNTNNDINSKQIYSLATNRNMLNNYKESEKIIINSEKNSAVKKKVKKKKKKIKKDDNDNKINIPNNNNPSNNQEIVEESNNNKIKECISNGKNDNINSRKNKRTRNKNIENKNILESCELNLKNYNKKYNNDDFTNKIKNKDNIEIYNRYKFIKNNQKLKKEFGNSILSGYNIKENYFPVEKTKYIKITNNYNNNINEKNDQKTESDQQNIPVFSMENYNKMKQQILSQYRASPNPIFNSKEGIVCDINMKKINDDSVNKRCNQNKKMRFKRQKNRYSNYKRLINNPSIEIYNLDDV